MRLSTRFAKKGFTLVELIVVIAIMAILGSVSYAFIISRMEKAKVTACQENMKQLANIGADYSEKSFHFQNQLPASGMEDNDETVWDEADAWWLSIAPLMDEVVLPDNAKRHLMRISTIFHCPGDKRVDVSGDKLFEADEKSVSYVSWSDASIDEENPNSGIQTSKGQRLSEMPWLSDGNPVKGKSVTDLRSFKSMVWPAIGRHDSTLVVVYADMSIKAIEIEDDVNDAERTAFKKIAPWLDANPVLVTGK